MMGQAKKRGTFEERRAEAIKAEAIAAAVRNEARRLERCLVEASKGVQIVGGRRNGRSHFNSLVTASLMDAVAAGYGFKRS